MIKDKIKVVIWDLDDTLWKGTLAEGDDVQLLENRVAIIKELNKRGIVNAICSKNDPDKAKSKLEEFKIWDLFVFPTIEFMPKGEMIKNLLSAMPWKYSPEKIIADKIVVACDVDYRIFRKNGFAKTDLWKVGLPRFDELHKANKSDKQRILYAPSWRSYLVGENVNGDWKALDKKFLSSRYYMETKAFLESDVLYKMLEKQEYTLDVKVHPIFQKYADNFIGSNDRIHLKSSINEEDYSLMITDFSSYMFDFLYLGTAIFSFIPDYQEFKCGMNGYRNVDFMTKIDEEEIAKTSDEIINKIEKFFMTRKGMLYDVHFWKNDICNATELIYQKMTNQPCKH